MNDLTPRPLYSCPFACPFVTPRPFAEPARDSEVVATLQCVDELVATGEAKNGFVSIDAANFSGWVQRTLAGTGGR